MATTDYKWPTLAEEGREMIYSATLMYGVATLRELARKGLLTKGDPAVNERILTLPVTVDDVLNATEANEDALKAHISEEDSKVYGTALLSLKSSLDGPDSSGSTLQIQLLAFDDEHSQNELVYGIEINHAHKRITVGFRGSVTVKDFMVDAKAYLCELTDPFDPDSGETLGIHHGFYEYLFETKTSGKGSNKGNKCEAILDQVASLFEEYPDYRLYATGHSLGMALATLFAVEAAASMDPRIPKPVSVIGIASPKVGNRAFLKCFQKLERKGLVRCLRIQNYNDAITILPDESTDIRCFSCGDRNLYKHVGLQITIDKNGAHKFGYTRDKDGSISRVMKNGVAYFGHNLGVLVMLPAMAMHTQEFLRNHSCGEYTDRFEKFSEQNGDLYLNDIYRDDVPDCDGEFGVSLH